MTIYSNVKNPVWANVEKTAINCTVDFDSINEKEVPFTAVEFGDYEHSNKIFAECLSEQYGIIGEYVPPPAPTAKELAEEQAIKDAKSSALIKLSELGLTEDEIKALIG